MSIRRIGVLLYKEIIQGPKNFLFLFALVVPVVLTLLVSLLFGSLFSGKPKMGITDAGASDLTVMAKKMDSLIVREYDSSADLERAAKTGAVDMGIALPVDFDQKLTNKETTSMTAFIFGESLIKNRILLISSLANWLREIAGQESPVEIITKTLGEVQSMSWETRLLPLIVLMSVLLGGVMVPATSLVEEKQKRTLTGLTVTPVTMGEIFTAKALLGVILSMVNGVMILLLNRSFGTQPGLLVFLLCLGAIFGAQIGVLLGAFLKDINTLFATIKSMGIFLYAPAIVYMFPAIPQWIGKIFPTYYMIQPVLEVTQNNTPWSEFAWQVYILIGLILVFTVILGLVARRVQEEGN